MTPERARLSPAMDAVLRLLEHRANAGEKCPTNLEVADVAGSGSMSQGSAIMAALADLGFIAIERGQCNRAVTILATGKRTAGVITPHWRDRPGAVQTMPKPRKVERAMIFAPEPAPVRRDRDPCPRCGVRGDVGCAHTASRLVA